jgi:hypothetical protein
VKKDPHVGADVMRSIVKKNEGVGLRDDLPVEDTKFLLNFSSLFYDNIYLDESKQMGKNSYFIEAFYLFAQTLTFKEDSAGNVVFSSPAMTKVVKVLFEGQTRKSSSINFLRFIFSVSFPDLSIEQIQESIIRTIYKPKKAAQP